MLRKILFIDKIQALQLAVKDHLPIHGGNFLAVFTNDVQRALQHIEISSFSLIILTLELPPIEGRNPVSLIGEKYPDIPIVVISEMPGDKVQYPAPANNVIACLNKPFETNALLTIIKHILRKEAEGGIMHDVSPAIFLQLMAMEARTCTIRIVDKASRQGGIIYCINGELVHVRIGALQGLDAALKVFTWDAVSIFFRNDCPARDNTINSGLQAIIMQAARMKDELNDSDCATADALDDLHLPSDFSTGMPIGQTAPGVFPQGTDTTKAQGDSPCTDTSDRLEKAADRQGNSVDIRHDESMHEVVAHLNTLGASSQFGDFQMGYIGTDQAFDRVLLPGRPPALVNVPENSPQDTIIELLRNPKDKQHGKKDVKQ